MVTNFLYSLTAAFLFAGMGIAAKILLVHFSPAMIVLFRFGSAVILLLPFVHWSEVKRITRREIMYFLLLGFVGLFLYNLFYFAAFNYSSVISVSLIAAINPLVALMVTASLARRIPSVEQLGAFVLAFVGVSLVITQGSVRFDAISGGWGDLLTLAAVVCQISFALLVKKMGTPFNAITRTFLTSVSGVLFLLPLCASYDLLVGFAQLDMVGWLALLYTILLGGALVLLLYVGSIHRLGAPLANLLLFSLVPVFTIPLSMLFLHSSPSVWQLTGGTLVLCALFFGLRHARKQELI